MLGKYKVLRKTRSIALNADKEKYLILERKNNIEGKKTRYYLFKSGNENSKGIFISSLHCEDINSMEFNNLAGLFSMDYKGAKYILLLEKNKAEIFQQSI